MGYDRSSSQGAFQTLNHLYGLMRLYGNFFHPVLKLQHKTRHGARVHKVYDTAKTPYRRLLESQGLRSERCQALERLYHSLNPVQLRAQINHTLEDLWALARLPSQKKASGTPSSEATYALR